MPILNTAPAAAMFDNPAAEPPACVAEFEASKPEIEELPKFELSEASAAPDIELDGNTSEAEKLKGLCTAELYPPAVKAPLLIAASVKAEPDNAGVPEGIEENKPPIEL